MCQRPTYEELEKRVRELEKAEAERIQAEAALRESEEKYRTLFNGESDALALIEIATGNMLEINSAFVELYGYTRQEVLRMKNTDFSAEPHETRKATRNRLHMVPVRWHKKKDGTVFPVEITASIFNYRGKEVHIASIRDITERMRVEEELRKRSEAIEASVDGIAILDHHQTYIYVNEAHAKIYGYARPEDLLGKTWHILYDKDELAVFEKEIMPTFMQTGKWRGESAGMKKDGSKFLQEVSLTALKDGGLVCVVRDITEKKKAEKEKLEAQRTAAGHEKYALVGQIAGKMAHDFNNILGAVMGNAQLAMIDCADSRIKKTLELIFDQTVRGKNLTKNLVAFAKDQEPRQEYFPINEKIDLVLNLLKKDLQGIEIVREWQPGLPDILADPGMIEHCLVNLLQNSIHATSRSKDAAITIRTYQQEKSLCIEFQDNGCGIPEEFIQQIFEPGFTLKGRLDVTGSYGAGIRGTGYGMANVKKYVEQHKGRIKVDSEAGKGTVVMIDFPVVQKELSDAEKAEILKTEVCSGRYILLVEDEQAISDVQYRILTSDPCRNRVDVAGTGRAAIDLFNRNAYDLVSLDYMLRGDISGMDVYDHIRSKNRTIPVLFISGNLEFLESIKLLKREDPHVNHISKPCTNKDYIDMINRLLL